MKSRNIFFMLAFIISFISVLTFDKVMFFYLCCFSFPLAMFWEVEE